MKELILTLHEAVKKDLEISSYYQVSHHTGVAQQMLRRFARTGLGLGVLSMAKLMKAYNITIEVNRPSQQVLSRRELLTDLKEIVGEDIKKGR